MTIGRVQTMAARTRRLALWVLLSLSISTAWSAQVSNPLSAEIPPHPYLLPFRNNIKNLTYDGNNLIITLGYQ